MHITLSLVKPKVKPQQKIRQNRADKKKGLELKTNDTKKKYTNGFKSGGNILGQSASNC